MSETAIFRHLTSPYCQGSGVDLGSGGDPVVPWAIQVELPAEAYEEYHQGRTDEGIELRGDATRLYWFADESLDFVYSSHLLEDFPLVEWPGILREWMRVLKPGGYLVLLVPDHERFRSRVAAGQPDNLGHSHEPSVGELSQHAELLGLEVIEDRFCSDDHYSILFVGRKP